MLICHPCNFFSEFSVQIFCPFEKLGGLFTYSFNFFFYFEIITDSEEVVKKYSQVLCTPKHLTNLEYGVKARKLTLIQSVELIQIFTSYTCTTLCVRVCVILCSLIICVPSCNFHHHHPHTSWFPFIAHPLPTPHPLTHDDHQFILRVYHFLISKALRIWTPTIP